MNHFFVFQNKGYKQEYGGGYLWAPKTDKRGVTKSHWRSMERAQTGDIIFSNVNQHIKAVAYVKDKSYECPRPEPVIEGLLEMDGFKLDVEYFFLKNPLPIDPYRNDLVKLMPTYNSPLNKKGNSNQGYLYDLTEAASDYIIDKIINSQSDEDFINFYTERFNGLDYGEQEVLNKISVIIIDDKPVIKNPHRPMPKKELVKDRSGKPLYPRDINKAINALKLSGYKCEFDKSHPTFKRKKDGRPYMEPHHLIPLSKHFDFENDLDVEANIISLCSNCHNLIHYGTDFEKILLRLYDERKFALSEAGIGIEFNILLGYYK